MSNRPFIARRGGGIQNHGAQPHSRVLSGNLATSEPHTLSTTVWPQNPDAVVPPEQSFQQPHLNVSASSSNSQQQVPLSGEVVQHTQEVASTWDPPSCGELPRAYWGPLHTPRFEDDPLDSEKLDPGTIDGRKGSKAFKAQKRRELRINLTFDENGLFVDKEGVIDKIISQRMRFFFEPSYTSWGKTPKCHRQLLYKEFGLACRCEPELEHQVANQWNTMSSSKYKNMWKNAKQFVTMKKVVGKSLRPKWMQVRHYWKCARYWNLPDVVAVALQNSKNRGVVYDETGQVVSKAKGTHSGGSTSIQNRGNSLLAFIETRVEYDPKPKEKQVCSVEDGTECIDGETVPTNPEACLNENNRIIVESYRKNLDEIYAGRLEDRPSDSAPRDPLAWSLAVGGPNRGRVLGVSSEVDLRLLGYATTKRQTCHIPSLANAFDGNIEANTQNMREKLRGEIMQELKSDIDKQIEEKVQIALAKIQQGTINQQQQRQYDISTIQQHDYYPENEGNGTTKENAKVGTDTTFHVPTDGSEQSVLEDFITLLEETGNPRKT